MSFKKKVNIAFVLIFIIMSVSVCLFNYIVDPYGLKYMSSNNFNIFHIPRNLVYSYINKTKNIKFDSVVIGGSSTGMIFHPSLFYRDTKENLAALQIEGILPNEMYSMLEYFLNMHPEIKKAYISLEPMQYIRCSGGNTTIPENPTNFIQDFISLYFSISATHSSIEKIKANIFKQEEDYDFAFLAHPELRCVYDNCYPEYNSYLKQIDDLLHSRNIERKYFVLPIHALFLSDMYNRGEFTSIEDFKREIVKVSPFYDMAFINEYTKDPFKYFWIDTLHMSQVLCPYIYEILVYDVNYTSFSQLITSENIEKEILEQRKLLEQYMSENKEYVDKYVTSDYNPAKDSGIRVKKYWKDMPEPYKTRFFTEYDEYYKDREKGKI